MKKIIVTVILLCWVCSSATAADWISLADRAVSLSASDISVLENKKNKTPEDLCMLTLLYYRNYDHAGLRRLFAANGASAPAGSEVRVLEAIILMREHRHSESRAVLQCVLDAQPDFHPARIVLAHLSYLQKDFTKSYALARQLIARKKELSKYHYTVSLLLAAGAKGMLTQKHMIRAIPAYFEITGYFREAKQLMPDSAEVLYGLGSYHLLTPPVAGGDIDKAIVMLEKSRRLTPQNTPVYVRLAQAYRFKGDETAWKKNVDRAMEIDPQDELLLDYLSGEKVFLDVKTAH
jgi:tetratricopeptide (TPR) repeat protein